MRIATVNLWGRRGPYEARLPLLRAELARIAPDVIGLQEVRTDGGSQASELGEGRYHEAFAAALHWDEGAYGNALLSRHPILSSETLPLPNEGGTEPRVLLASLLDTPHGTLPFYVTHLAWEPDAGFLRRRQVLRITELIAERTGDLPAVLVGDFNAAPDTDEIRFLRGRTLLEGRRTAFDDAWAHAGAGPGHTIDQANGFVTADEPNRRIDYIFCARDTKGRGEPLTTELAFTTPTAGVWPTDHYGLITKLSLGTR